MDISGISQYFSGISQVYLWHIPGISQAYLRNNLDHISGKYQEYLRHISRKSQASQAYLWHISRIFPAYLRDISCKSSIRNISGISMTYLKHILNISMVYFWYQGYFRQISDISLRYLKHISGKSQANLIQT